MWHAEVSVPTHSVAVTNEDPNAAGELSEMSIRSIGRLEQQRTERYDSNLAPLIISQRIRHDR